MHGLGLVHILHCHCLCVGFLNFEIYTVIYKYIIFPCWECLLALSQLGINWYTNNKVVSIWKWDACPRRSTPQKRIIADIGSLFHYRCQHWESLPWWPGCSWLQPPGHPRHCTSAQTGSWLRLGPCEPWPQMMRRILPGQDTGESRGRHTISTKQLLTSCKYKRNTNSYSVLLCIETKNPLD